MVEMLKFNGEVLKRGSRQIVRIPVTTDLNGSPIVLTVHALAGIQPGRTLALLCALHGAEWLPVEFLGRLLSMVDPARMTGNILVVPVANPVAFQNRQRFTPDQSDSPDLNRSFPGGGNWIAEQLARTIVDNVLAQSDNMMDFHGGGFARASGSVMYGCDLPDPAVVEASKQMAKAFKFPSIRISRVVTDFPGPKSSFGYAGAVMNIPNIGPEIGGAGFDDALEEQWIGQNLEGTLNVMRYLKILPEPVTYLDRYFLWERRWRVNPSVGGLLQPVFKVYDHLKTVAAGQVLGRVISPYTYEELEVLRAPGDGRVFQVCRSGPMRPGDFCYGVIDVNYPGTRWARPDEF